MFLREKKRALFYSVSVIAGFFAFLFREWILQAAKDVGLFANAGTLASEAVHYSVTLISSPVVTHTCILVAGVIAGWQVNARWRKRDKELQFRRFGTNIYEMEKFTREFEQRPKISRKGLELSEELLAEQRTFYAAARSFGLTTPRLDGLTPPQIVAALQTFISHMKPLAPDNLLSEARKASVEISKRVGTD